VFSQGTSTMLHDSAAMTASVSCQFAVTNALAPSQPLLSSTPSNFTDFALIWSHSLLTLRRHSNNFHQRVPRTVPKRRTTQPASHKSSRHVLISVTAIGPNLKLIVIQFYGKSPASTPRYLRCTSKTPRGSSDAYLPRRIIHPNTPHHHSTSCPS
jgi:hypothetical protein